jgi:hypothetical protein
MLTPHSHDHLKTRFDISSAIDIPLLSILAPANIDKVKSDAFKVIGNYQAYQDIKNGLQKLWSYEQVAQGDKGLFNAGVAYVKKRTGKTYSNLDILRSDSLISYLKLSDFGFVENKIFSANAVALTMNWN